MSKNTDEKHRLIKAITISALLILLICMFSMAFAQKASEIPEYTEEEAEEIFSTLDGTLLSLDKSQKAKVESFFNISGMKTMEFQRNGAALRIIFSDGRTSYIFMFHPEDGAIICEEKEDTIALILNNDAILLVLNDSDILELPLQ